MADFTQAFKLTSAHEGGYVNDRTDRGGETYRGISRVHHPDWSGWKRIDTAKRKRDFPRSLGSDRTLQANVKALYKKMYWDVFNGDGHSDQAVANELYDTAVNMGVRRAVRFLQSALNLLNRNQKIYKDLIVDGWFGNKSMTALGKLLDKDGNSDALVKMMNIQQGARYIEIMSRDSTQERFARGWIKRA